MKQIMWTIQHEAAWEAFEKSGILVADENHLFCGDDMRFAYDWISRQMTQKIGAAPQGVHYPVWAWYLWEGKRKRQDLRNAGYAERGTPMVQITFEAEKTEFLLSDFDLWCRILAGDFLARSEAEWDAFYAENPHPTQKDVEASWSRVFDLTAFEPNWDYPPDRKSVQATLWQIKMEQVKKVEHFIAK